MVGLAAGEPIPEGSPAMKMLGCESCKTVMAQLSLDVGYLVQSEKMWKPKDLRERIQISCSDPTLPDGAMKEACAAMMAKYHEAIARDITLRWMEDSDEFEEDIEPKSFCQKLGVCKGTEKSINEMMEESDRKQKAIKW